MTLETKYSYEKKIKQLNDDLYVANEKLTSYRLAILNIYDGIVDVVSNGKQINTGWVLAKIKGCLK